MATTLYETLGIHSSASSEEIKVAFKNLAKKYHPDKNPGSTSHEEQFKKINQAYQLLSDPAKKLKYDQQLEYLAFKNNQNSFKKVNKKTTKTKSPNPNQKKTDYTYLFILLFFIVIGFIGFAVYTLMNQYTARDIFKEATRYSEKGRHKEAFLLYTDALSFDTEFSEAYEGRGTARIASIGDYKGATRDFTNAIINSASPTSALYFKRVKCYIRTKEYKSALIDLDSILSINKNEDSAYYYKAELNYLLENYEPAINNYTIFIKLDPKAGDAFLKRGYCHLKQYAYQKALIDFNYIISKNPTQAETYYYRGLTHFGIKDSTKACLDLTYAKALGFREAAITLGKYCN